MATLSDLLTSYKLVELPTITSSRVSTELPSERYLRMIDYIDKKQNPETQVSTEETPMEFLWHYDPNSSNSKNTSNINFTPGDNAEAIRSFFGNHFKSNGVVAGIMGAMHGESGLNPAAINKAEKNKGYKGYGRGLFQWSNSRVDAFRNKYNAEIEESPLETLLDFAWSEFNSRPALMQRLNEIESNKVMTESEKARLTVDAIVRGYLNGSANAMATVDLMNSTYGKAWSKLPGYGNYDYETSSLNRRDKYAQGYLQ